MGHYFGALHGFGAQTGAPFYRLRCEMICVKSRSGLALFMANITA